MHDERVNAEMVAAWDGDEGAEWARDWKRRDQAVHGYHAVLLDAAAISASRNARIARLDRSDDTT